ncbi:transporter [Subtercola boreus]|uniref:Transporter n=1 Tax=Subtercola boreus TaxID=120213 RepID=A0A3E0W3W5_9MICO|nr:carbohydrate ABC transporter permease [Subtercola boreus]RFA16896.1 transporter [Subtercola boreus]
MAYRTRHKPKALVVVADSLVWLYGLIILIPVYYLIVTSLKTNTEIFSAPAALPTHAALDNFINAANFASLPQALINSSVITIGAELVTLGLAIPAAYGLSRTDGKIGAALERVFSAGFLIPAFAALVPTVILAVNLNLFYNPIFLVIFYPATQLPLSVVLLTQYMRSIPKELEESSMMDGANRWTVLWRIYTPLIVPGLVSVALLNFLTFWNEYLFSLSILGTDTAVRTVQVAVPALIGQQTTNYGILAAGCIISIIPVLVVYLLLQRQMENALVAGALKG